MTRLDAVRTVSQQELAAWRERNPLGGRRGVYTARAGSALPDGVHAHQVTAAADGQVYVSKPKRVGVKREARDVRDALTDRRLASILARGRRDPEFVKELAAVYRKKFPDLGSRMTDTEIIAVALERAHRMATERAFRKIGRGGHSI